MRHAAAALLLILGAETAALACSCVPPPTASAEARAAAREVARNLSAVVEAEVVSGYDDRRNLGEWVRVRRVLAGRAPAAFRVHRIGRPNSAACGVELARGSRPILLLYPVRAGRRAEPVRAIQSLCTGHWASDPRLRQLVIAELRRRR